MRAAIYCRISNDAESRELGVIDQQEDCRKLADRLGFKVVQVYVENDVSASTASKKPRPEYQRMIRSVRTGEVDVILAYSLSRLTRRVREFLDLIDLNRETGVQIKTCVSGDPDLSTADGRGMAINIANWDQMEAERTAERVKRRKRSTAEKGGYRGGPRPYGFEKDGIAHRPDEAEVIRRATKAVLAGRSLTAIVRELNEEGCRTSFGNEWSRHSLRDVLLRPRNAGLVHTGRVRKDEIKIVGPLRDKKGEQIEPIVDRDQFDAVCHMLLDPARRNHESTDSKWLGSSIYVCGREGCGGLMRSFSVPRGGGEGKRGKPARRLPAYKCAESDHVSVMAVKTDDFVREVLAEHLRDPRMVEAMTKDDGDALRVVRERRAVLVKRLEQTENDYDNDLIDARRYSSKVAKIETELQEIDLRLADAAQHSASSAIFNAADPGRAFLDAPLDLQRAVLRLSLRVEVLPHTGPRGAAWSSERLRITPMVVPS